MSQIEKNISQFIQNQFPAIYREEGELFVKFVTKYYEWMEESNNVMYHTRRLTDYHDIDTTIDDFVLKYKKKYLRDTQFSTAAQTKTLVKHSLDIYRSKGTEQSVDLFFRSIYGSPAEVYYPGEDIFRLSDGRWVQPKYLEVTPSDLNTQFVGKIVEGVNSKATAFVERYVKRKIKSKYIHLFYISAISGEFETGEQLTLNGVFLKNTPMVIGSMSGLQIITGGASFKVGDIVSLTSNNGLQGKARVSSISDLTGTVSYELLDSGWGYSSNAEVLVSEKVLTLSNVVAGANVTDYGFEIFETLKQPFANISLINANNTLSLVNNSLLFTYYANGNVAGKGRVLGFTANGSTNGEVYVAELLNDLGPVIEPSANATGTVALSVADTPINGISTTTVDSAVIDGVGSFYSSDLLAGQVIKLLGYDANNQLIATEEKVVQSIANDTQLTVSSNVSFTSSNVSIQTVGSRNVIGSGTTFTSDFVYGDKIAFYSNSTNYVTRTVNAVSNNTYLTLQEPVNFANGAASYAKMFSNNTIYTEGNAISANIFSRADKSATANVMGISTKNYLKLVNCSAEFSNTDVIYQLDSNNEEIASSNIVSVVTQGSNASIITSNTVGVFRVNTSQPIRTRSNKTANVVQLDIEVGVIDIANTLSTIENNFVYGTNSSSNATLIRVSTGSLANFSFSNTLTYPETITVSSDMIEPYQNVPLNALSYGFPANPTANLSTQYLEDIFSTFSITIGGISSLVNVNPGKDYDYAPLVTIYDPITAVYDRHDYRVDISNISGGVFTVGEEVYQTVGGSGIVKSSNATHIDVKRLNFENNFDFTEALIGRSSGVTANIVSISEIKNIPQIGLNAMVQTNVQTSTGSVSTLDIVDSGFGYIQDEIATFTSSDGSRSGIAKISLGKLGKSEGFYQNKNGQISSSKKIFDGEYYQEFSYEIRSPIRVDKYSEMLKNILHVSGTKMFSATVLSDVANSAINIKSEIVTE